MLGAIVGDIIGSIYEGSNINTPYFYPLVDAACRYTDDSVLTVAVGDWIMGGAKDDLTKKLKWYFTQYPYAGYGCTFMKWAASISTSPYNSWGNGSAMRVSAVGWAFDTIDEVMDYAERSAAVTHNHPEGIKGAQATAAAIFLARTGSDRDAIRQFVTSKFGYDLSRRCDEIRPTYKFDVSCQGSVPQAITAFLESTDYENAVRLAISLGGDSDTIACICGGIAEAFYRGVPKEIENEAMPYFDKFLREKMWAFHDKFVRPKLKAS